MKKRLIALVLALLLSLSLFVLPASAAGGSVWQESYDLVQLAAYQKSGRSLVGNIAWRVSAIPFVRLLDMDGDGVNELLFAINDTGTNNRPAVYGAADAALSVFRWNGSRLVRLDGVPGTLDGGSYSVELSHGSDGKSYFYRAEGNKDAFYGIRDGALTRLDLLSSAFTWDWGYDWQGEYIHSDSGRMHYYSEATGRLTEISQAEYNQRQDLYGGGGRETIRYETGRDSGDLSAVIAALAEHVDRNYIDRYESPSGWAADGVNDANSHGYVPGRLNNRYAAPITRAEFCELAVQYFETITGVTISERKTFTDTDSAAVQKLAGRGVINGYGGGLFGPDDLLTREQAAVILSNFAEKCLNTPLTQQYTGFTDSSEFSSWARTQVARISGAGIMNGVGNGRFDAKGYYTREQSILTIIRMVDFTPLVQGLEITADKEILLAGQSTTLRTVFTPANAVNGATRWSSSNPGVLSVDAYGRVSAVREGTATVTAVTSNGTTATYTITVRPKDYIGLKVDYDRYYDFLYQTDSGFYRYGIGYTPDDPRVAGSVRITDAQWKTKSQSSGGTVNGSIEISGVVSALYDQIYGSGITPYFKWRLYDKNNRVAASGVEKLYVYGSNRDFTTTLSITGAELDYGYDYRLEFISEEGLSINEVMNDGPTIDTNAPYMVSAGYSYPKDYATIEDIMVELSYNGRYNTYSATVFLYGSVELNSGSARSFTYKWTLYDSSNKTVASSSYATIYSSDIDSERGIFSSELSRTLTDLKPGETYRLIFNG